MASEVYIPTSVGEVGILPEHGDYIGLLATGVMRFTVDGNVYKYVVSSGTWRVDHGKLVVLAEVAEQAEKIDASEAIAMVSEIEKKLLTKSTFDTDAELLQKELKLAQAKVECSQL